MRVQVELLPRLGRSRLRARLDPWRAASPLGIKSRHVRCNGL